MVTLKVAATRIGLGGIYGAVLTSLLGLGVFFTNLHFYFERWSYDIPYAFGDKIAVSGVEMVYIDEASHINLNQPKNAPWDRRLHARLIERCQQDGAKAVIFDVIFSDPAPEPDQDEHLARAIRNFGKVVLAADHEDVARSSDLSISAPAGRILVPPIEPFSDGAAGVGLVELRCDDDLILRRHFHGRDDDPVGSLSWATAEVLQLPITKSPEQRLAERWVNYYGPPHTLPGVSFSQSIITNDLPPLYFSNKVVFVGSKMKTRFSGDRKDSYPSPFPQPRVEAESTDQFMPGVDLHATQFLNLERGDWLNRLDQGQQAAFLLAIGVAIGFGLAQFRPLSTLAIAIITAFLLVQGAFYLFNHQRIFCSWMIPVAVQIPVALLWSISFNSIQLYVQKRLMEQSLGMYVSPSRVKQILRRPEILRPGAEKQELSILFSDIANFTSFSEGMDSDELARLMNNYFETAVTHCIHATEGTVVKFIGDAIFAIWNAPEPQNNHHALACRAALLLRDKVTGFKISPATPNIKTRIGLHSGVANVGNFGSSKRIDYTAIGENINLASRMEGLNKYLGTTLILTGDLYQAAHDQFVFRWIGPFRLKGFEKAVQVYELIDTADHADTHRARLQAFQNALRLFHQKDFDAAEVAFRRLLEKHPEDGPTSFYLHQIEEARAHPHPDSWQGEIEMKEK